MAAANKDEIEKKLREAFVESDTDKSGDIDGKELKAVLKRAGFCPTDQDAADLLKAADSDGSGRLEFEEFAAAVIGLSIAVRVAMVLRALFTELDVDGSGYLTKSDLVTIVKDSGYGEEVDEAQMEELIKAADTDGDDKVSFEEFAAAFGKEIEEHLAEELAS